MEIAGINPVHLVGGMLIFIRALGIFSTSPVFGHMHLPAQLKVGLALMISLVLVPIVPAPDVRIADNFLLLLAAVMKEAVVGLIIGYIASMVFMAIQLAGEAIDIQIGFGLANIADPLLGTQASLVGQFKYLFATLFFLAVNGHHFIIKALINSFELVPLNGLAMQPVLEGQLLDILAQMFLIGLRIGAPVMLAVFLTDLALGLLGRTVPQMNLLMVGFPIKILVGLLMLLVSTPFFLILCRVLFSDMYQDIHAILRSLN